MSITLSALQQQRRDTAANWTSANPTLLAGEWGYETDTGKWKVGDGSTTWTSLGYVAIPDNDGLIPIDQLLLPAGTAAAPSLTFTGDVDTGIYRTGADGLGFSTGGTGRLFIDSSGKVGVGLTPAYTLDIKAASSGSDTTLRLSDSGSNDTVIRNVISGTTGANSIWFGDDDDADAGKITYLHSQDAMTFNSGGNTTLTLNSSQNVGIGTLSPGSKLEVYGNSTSSGGLLTLNQDGTGDATLDFVLTGTREYSLGIDNSDSDKFKLAGTAGLGTSDLLTITSSGDVGVGTSSPGSPLHVYNATTDTVANFESGDASVAVNFTASDNSMQIATSSTDGLLKNNGAGSLRFFNNGSERFRVDSSGNVGIGTSSPNSILHIKGGGPLIIENGPSSSFGVEEFLRVDNGGVVVDRALQGFELANGGSRSHAISHNLNITSDGSAYTYTQGNYSGSNLIEFENGQIKIYADEQVTSGSQDAITPTEVFRIDNNGKVGIGTPSPGRQLHIAGTNNILRLESTSTVASRIEFENTGSSSSDSVSIGSVNNDMQLVTSGSERMRIDSSGNLLLGGTASPTSATKSLAIFNGTAPTASVTDGIVLYAEDVSSSSELKVRDEAGNVTTLSPHNFDLIPEGPSEDMAWSYYSEKDGKRINVDMLKAVRLLEQLTGEKLVFTA